MDASGAIIRSQAKNLKYFNRHNRPAIKFEEGDFVVIKNEDTSVGTNEKLLLKYRGRMSLRKNWTTIGT